MQKNMIENMKNQKTCNQKNMQKNMNRSTWKLRPIWQSQKYAAKKKHEKTKKHDLDRMIFGSKSMIKNQKR